MAIGVMLSGLLASFLGFFGTLIVGHDLQLALISYSLTGVCGALMFVWLVTPMPIPEPGRKRN